MTDVGLIQGGWTEIEEALEFCCDYHRGMTRTVYFAGAMNAIAAATTWTPGIDKAEIKPSCLNLVCEELDIEHLSAEREAEGVGNA